jgi:hypothetical protein
MKTFPFGSNGSYLHNAKENTLSKFYLVQKNGVPAVWQAVPERLAQLLKRKDGFTVVSETPNDTRAEALIRLRQVFPGSRPAKSA